LFFPSPKKEKHETMKDMTAADCPEILWCTMLLGFGGVDVAMPWPPGPPALKALGH
jgi:hypothetical protein